jgi:uncharacterized protein (TIGR02145 family)
MKNRLWSVLAVATVWGFTACGGDSSSSGVDVSDDADAADVIEEPESSSGKEDKKSSSSVVKEDSKKSSSSEADDKSEKENSADSKNSSSSAKNGKSSSSDEENVSSSSGDSSSNTAKSSSSGNDKVESSSSVKKNDSSSSSNTKDVSSSSTAQSSSSCSSETFVASSSSETPVNTSTSVQTGTYFVDERDDRSYRTVQIGKQVWMAENMKLDVSDGFCYNDTKKNCETYGVFYTAQTAVRVCPEGWSLPTKNDWDLLAANLSGYLSSDGTWARYEDADAISKIRSSTGWNSNNGTDELGFSAFPAGQFDGTNYTDFGKKAYFMGSAYSGGDGEYAYITKNSLTATGVRGISSKLAMPVRCVQTQPCTDDNQDSVTIGGYICDNKKWRPITEDEFLEEIEKNYVQCNSLNEGKVVVNPISKNNYICNDYGKWKVATSLELTYGLCTASNIGTIKGSYICENRTWRIATKVEKSNGLCYSANEGEVKNGYTCVSVGHSVGTWIMEGSLTDERNGYVYKTVFVGNYTWMAENLAYRGTKDASGNYEYGYVCDEGGVHYYKSELDEVCPSGWHVPDRSEWINLINAVGGSGSAGYALKATSGWKGDRNGIDAIGFAAYPMPGMYGGFGCRQRMLSNSYDMVEFWVKSSEGLKAKFDLNNGVSITTDIVGSETTSFIRCVKDEN